MVEKKIRTKVIIEVIGAPKEHIEKALGMILNRIKEEKYLEVVKAISFEAKQLKDKIYTTFAETEIHFDDINKVIDFCFNYMPSSIEILEPTELTMSAKETNDMLNDVLAGLHKYEMVMKNLHAQNILMKRDIEKNKKD